MSFVWLVWGCVVVGGLCVAAFQSVAHIDIPSRQIFAGSLSPRMSLHEVRLPRSAMIQELVLKEGDTVLAGQTLVALDKNAMTAKRVELARSLRVSRFLIACLQKRTSQSVEDSQNVSEEELALLAHSKSTCDEFFDRERQRLAAITESKDLLNKERALIQQYMDLRVLGLKTPKPEKTEQIVSLSLLNTQLERQILEMELQQTGVAQQASRERSAMVRRELTKVYSHLDEIARLDALIAHPRIVSPHDGQVLRIRRPVGDAIMRTSDVSIQIGIPASPKFAVTAHVPIKNATDLTLGQPVEFRILSLAALNSHDPLSGKVSSIGAATGESVEVELEISARASTVLTDATNGLAFAGKATAAEISVRTKPQSFQQHLAQNLSNAVPEMLQAGFEGFKRTIKLAVYQLRKSSAEI